MTDKRNKEYLGNWNAADKRVAIVVAQFNEFITGHLLSAARKTWQRLGGKEENLTVAWVPGSLELPVTAKKLALGDQYQSVICLGCVIRGETDHYDHVVTQTAKGVRQVSVETGVPCIFGVITCDTLEQAIHRAGAKMGNQGEKAVLAALQMASVFEQIESDQ